MILRSIRVEGWRCFAEAFEVGPFSDGLNVICGPNGVGKSSLFMALGRGLFDDHASSAEAIKQLRPWGRELAPRVTIDFEHDGSVYRLHKQFLDGKAATLWRMEGGHYVPKSEGRAADNEVRELLRGDAFGRREATPATWGLAQVLWASQGRIEVGQVTGPCKQALQQALGAQVVGTDTGAIEQRIREVYLESFTPGGKYKSGAAAPPIVSLEAELQKARQDIAELRRRLAEFNDASRRIEDCANLASQWRTKQEAFERDLAHAGQRAEQYDRLVSETQRCEQAAVAARARFEQWHDRIQAIATATAEAESCERQLNSLEADTPLLAAEMQQRKADADVANAEMEKIRARRGETSVARRLAEHAERYLRAQETVAALRPRIDHIREAQRDIQLLDERRRPIVAPDEGQLRAIRKAGRERDDARLRLEASLITLEVVPERPLTVSCIVNGQAEQRELATGEPALFRGAPSVVVAVAGVGTIRAAGPAQSAESLKSECEEANERFGKLLRQLDTEDLDELERRRQAADVLDQELAKARLRRDMLLDGCILDELQAELLQAEQTVAGLLDSHPEWSGQPPSPAACRAEAEQIEQRFVNEIDRAEAERREAVGAVTRVAERLTLHEQQLAHTKKQIAAARGRIEQHTADGLSQAERQQRQTEAAMEHEAARQTLAQAQLRLADFGGDPRQDVKVLEGQLRAIRDEAVAAAQRLHHEQGRLKTLIDQAPYSALGTAEERAAAMEEEIARQRLQLEAIKLLHETVTRRKREFVESLLGPVSHRAMQTLNRIAGSRFSRLELNDDFALDALMPAVANDTIKLDQLSGGEREQAHFAVRLALADVAFAGRRELVVLDDVFTFTDTSRIARIATILAEAAERFQIILLTCHPERYRALEGARFFDVEEHLLQRRSA